MSLKAGNDYYKQELYDKALKEYEKIDDNSPLYKHAEFNIKIIESRKSIGINFFQNRAHVDISNNALQVNTTINTDKDNLFKNFLNYQFNHICPLLSIVIPCFNGSKFIEKTINNILTAKTVPLEIIIVNDGSTDNTLNILQNLSGRYPNIKVLSQENSGAGIARNKAISQCNGTYTFFLDADDEIDATELSRVVLYAMRCELDLIFFPYQILYVEKNKIGNMYPNDCEIFKTAKNKTSQALLQNLAMKLTGFPWNRLILTKFLHQQQIKFGNTTVHNDILFHWHSICCSERLDFWYEIVCTHKKFQSGTLSSRNDKSRLSVFDALLQIYNTLENNTAFKRNIDVYNDISEKIIEWNGKIIMPEFLEEFNRAKQSIERKNNTTCNVQNVYCNEEKKLVSIITVTKDILGQGEFERAQNLKYFKKMLNSVIAQSYGRDNIQHIVIDGASIDGTKELLNSYFKIGLIDEFISEPDGGIYSAMNKGIKYAKGEAILFLNAQDYLAQNAVNSLMKHIKKTGASCCFGNSITVDNKDFPIGKHDGNINKIFFGMPYCHQTAIFDAEIFKQIIFPENLKITTWGFALNVYFAGFKHSYLSDTIAFFRNGGVSTSERTRQAYYGELKHLRMYIASNVLKIPYELYIDMRSMSQDIQSIPFDKFKLVINKIISMNKNNINADFLSKFVYLLYSNYIE